MKMMNRAERIITPGNVLNEKLNKKGVNNESKKKEIEINHKIDSKPIIFQKSKTGLEEIEKFLNWLKWYKIPILETRNWKVMKESWSNEDILLSKQLDFQARSKVRVSRKYEDFESNKNFKAFLLVLVA